MTMRAYTEAARALGYVTAAALDPRIGIPMRTCARRKLAFAELMIPIVKGWSTEVAQQIAYLGVQVHGGMGFIEETGAAQYVRDARITTIYEGTTGIQANDLIGRKIARDGGAALAAAIATCATSSARSAARRRSLAAIGARLRRGLDALGDAGTLGGRAHRATTRAWSSPARCRFSSSPASFAAARSSRAARSLRPASSAAATATPPSCARRSRRRATLPITS